MLYLEKTENKMLKIKANGGVLISVSTNLLSEEVKELQSDSEIVWA
jgi:hypothetical protein